MKKVLAAALAFSLSLCLFAKGGGEKTAEKITIRWGSVHADTHPATKMMMKVIEKVNAECEGVKIEGYPNGQLGSSRDLVEGVQVGLVDMCTEGPAQFATSGVALADLCEAPYLWKDVAHMSRALNGGFGDMINKQFAEVNVKMLGSFYYGTRQLSTNKPISSVKDMAGMKIRVPESTLYLEMVKSWGAKATPINFNELYLSLQQNVVDGQENPVTTFNSGKFYEVQKYINITNHIICPNMIFINKDVWNKISAKDQAVIKAAVAEAIAWQDSVVLAAEKSLLSELEKKGVTTSRPDVESFRAVTAPAVQAVFANKWGKDTWSYIQGL